MNNLNPPMAPFIHAETGFTLDISGMDLDPADLLTLREPMARAHEEIRKIEAGAIKNPDENRKVTHFTDRLNYPKSRLFQEVEAFAREIAEDDGIDQVLINGIGGSALGPQLLQMAINGPYWNEFTRDRRRGYPKIYFVDNTDPAGLMDALAVMDLRRSLTVTISKSGATQETKNNMLVLAGKYQAAGLDFGPHAVGVTMPGSELDRYAREHHWRRLFPMAESIGGRTSETNIVGHLPAALAGIDFANLVAGAAMMDELTRIPDFSKNPGYLLAATWFIAGQGLGNRNMVVVPYSDRLSLFGKYLQQLVMESLGKEKDLDGKTVHQGLTVYGNKGGTDAHAYIQQLNDGRDDFFITFIEILADAADYPIDQKLTMGDYLHGFKEGLARALRGKGRRVIDITVDRLNPCTLGMLIALYERAVAVYAELIHINAFHQPGVQAYKLASKEIITMNLKLQDWLGSVPLPWTGTAADAAAACGCPVMGDAVGALLRKFAVNQRRFNSRAVVRSYVDGVWKFQILL